ncbi:hypothetical protein QE152_g824 [Popillia japonica]|uniref:Uncharacterized protein n=1 Tax=Popillia japonica TaxID=7064 RepID=A0AAW1NAJ2_POPJA
MAELLIRSNEDSVPQIHGTPFLINDKAETLRKLFYWKLHYTLKDAKKLDKVPTFFSTSSFQKQKLKDHRDRQLHENIRNVMTVAIVVKKYFREEECLAGSLLR